MRRPPVSAALVLAAFAVGCSSAPAGTPTERFVAQLQQPGTHRFDQVVVGDGTALQADQATCVATAFERNRWPLESALAGKLPTQVDVRLLNTDVKACIQDPSTTTTGPFG